MNLLSDPVQQLSEWYDQAKNSEEAHPDAITLATVGLNQRPAARMVLFKGISKGGIEFYTNYNSRKAKELKGNPHVALVFYWPTLYRQVRVEGKVMQLSRSESEEYFKTRARLSQIGAWASNQSEELDSRTALEDKFKEFEERFQSGEVPCPPHWGGYRVVPEWIEFWIGRENRLHDRFAYELKNGKWDITQLNP